MTTSPTPRSLFFSLAATVLLLSPVAAQSTTRVSVDSAGVQGNNRSLNLSISADGRFVAFDSLASNLVVGDANGLFDIFVHDRQSGRTELVSKSSAGVQGNLASSTPSISSDGRFVCFQSQSDNLVSGDSGGHTDVFVHDRQTGQTSRLSLNSAGVQGNGESNYAVISGSGRLVAFQSRASNLVTGDTNGVMDVFVHDRQTGLTKRVSVSSTGGQANGESGIYGLSLSADGSTVAFWSWANNLVPGDTNGFQDVFVHDLAASQTSRVSINSAGVQGNWDSYYPSLSADGILVAFKSGANNLVTGDTNGMGDLFVHDRQTGLTTRVNQSSAGGQTDRDSDFPSLSANGRFVAFYSAARNLVTGDTNGVSDAFLHDRQTGQTVRVSVNSAGSQGNRNSGGNWFPSLSADGRVVAFDSDATNLVPGDTNGQLDSFVRELSSDFSLASSGICPGPIQLRIANATPSNWVALVYGSTGAFVKPGAPCQGLMLGLNAPSLRRLLWTDAAGEVSYITIAGAAACGLTLQAVDAATCTASNTLVL